MPTLPAEEIQGMSSLWSKTTTTTLPNRPTNHGAEESSSDSSSIPPYPPSRTGTGSLSERNLSSADSTGATSPQLNGHKLIVPAYEKSYEPVRQPVVALPGTMSSRAAPDRRHMVTSKVSDKRQHKKAPDELNESTPLSHRFTSAVRGLFRKHSVSDVQLEHIGERHWSED